MVGWIYGGTCGRLDENVAYFLIILWLFFFFQTKYFICAKMMTVKWDMQQKHGSPPRIVRNSSCYFGWFSMTPMHFTALSMVDISYFVDGGHHCQHAASKQMNERKEEGFLLWEKGGRGNGEDHEVKWTTEAVKLKISHIHHCRMEMHVWDYKMQRDDVMRASGR